MSQVLPVPEFCIGQTLMISLFDETVQQRLRNVFVGLDRNLGLCVVIYSHIHPPVQPLARVDKKSKIVAIQVNYIVCTHSATTD